MVDGNKPYAIDHCWRPFVLEKQAVATEEILQYNRQTNLSPIAYIQLITPALLYGFVISKTDAF